MRILKAIVGLACFLLNFCTHAQSIEWRVDNFLAAGIDDGFSGSVLVANKGEIILNQGYGLSNKKTTVYNQPNTVFDIGSNTKQFTSAAILKLEENRLLTVEDSLYEFFEDLPIDKQNITIHQLLTHTSGFRESIGSDFDKPTSKEFFDSVFQSKTLFSPGYKFNYSNIGYSILARIIEIVSGMEYEVYLHHVFFAKAGMYQTGYLRPDWDSQNLAIGYNRNIIEQGTTIARYQKDNNISWHLMGNGGINSTNDDILRWIQAIKSGQVLSEESISKWTHPYVLEVKHYYGYGWGVYHPDKADDVIYHNGGNGAYAHTIIWDRHKDLVILFATNASSRYVENIAFEIQKMALDKNYTPEPIKKNPYYLIHSFIELNNTDQSHNLLNVLEKDYKEEISDPSLLNRMGYVTLRKNKTDWAVELFKINTALFPHNGNTWDSLGESYTQINENDKAIKCFIKALELGSDESCTWCEGTAVKLKELTALE